MNLATRATDRRRPETNGVGKALSRSRWLRAGLVILALLGLFLALFYPEENRRGKRAWEKYHQQLANEGVELDWHKLGPPAVPDEDNLAKTPFLAALFDFEPGTYTPRDLNAYNRTAGFAQFEEPYAEARGPAEPPAAMAKEQRIDLAEALRLSYKAKSRTGSAARSIPKSNDRRTTAVTLLEALEEFQPVLTELRTATARPGARLRVSYQEDYPWRLVQPYLPVLKRVSRISMWHGTAELATQNSGSAAADVSLLLALARAVGSEPFRSSFLARNVMLQDARQIVWEGLADRRWSDTQLSELEVQLQQIAPTDVRRAFEVERATINSFFEMLHKDPKIVNGWQFGPGISEKARGFVLRHMPEGWMYLEQCSYQRAFEAWVVPAFDGAEGRLRPGMIDRATYPGALWGHHLLAGPVLSSAEFMVVQAALAQTGVNQAVLACALERYRLANQRFPTSLEELVPRFVTALPGDIISGQPMKYRRTDDGGFVLYSVGQNEKDDGGRVVLSPATKAPDLSQGDWVWPAYPAQQ